MSERELGGRLAHKRNLGASICDRLYGKGTADCDWLSVLVWLGTGLTYGPKVRSLYNIRRELEGKGKTDRKAAHHAIKMIQLKVRLNILTPNSF